MLVLGSGEGGKFLAWHTAKSGHRTAVLSDDVSLWKSSFTKAADIHLGLPLAHTSYPRGKPVGSIDRFVAT
jgi:hypothetical protein